MTRPILSSRPHRKHLPRLIILRDIVPLIEFLNLRILPPLLRLRELLVCTLDIESPSSEESEDGGVVV